VTLAPTEGIGVFAYSLIAGLLDLDEPLEVVLLVRPGDQRVAEVLGRRNDRRLKVVPDASTPATWVHFTDRARSYKKIAERVLSRFRLLAWPRQLLSHLLRRIGRFDRSAHWQGQAELARAAACDVWLIPSADFQVPLNFPAVLAVHDLVCVRFPQMWERAEQRRLETTVRQRAREATLCASMSSFIRDEDLIGILGLPSAKTRVIAPAPPVEFSALAADAAPALPDLKRPYVFYPAAFRPYKNHLVLIEALPLLEEAGQTIDLVFTGIHEIPAELRQRIERLGLSERIHRLGCVNPAAMDKLYREALATIIPALYEQGSFPIYEALRRGCPVACSRIAPYQEQCAALGDSMLYFDPRSPREVADIIMAIARDRKAIRERQQRASQVLWQRTWQVAAREWLSILREAAATEETDCSVNRLAPVGSDSISIRSA
jgi:glycosyltransferase involved in cell wall biosynthesis